jgi:hypothetical protein
MPLIVKDRVQETSTTTGTGTLTLAGAVTGFQDFSVIGNGNTTYYTITSNGAWEVGIGTYTSSGTTLSRDTVLESSNSGSKITLTGVSNVFVTYPAEKSVDIETAQTLTNKTLTSPTLTAPVLGTPASGSVTNLTGTASININGTVGATTPNTGAFTTLSASSNIQLSAAGTSILNSSGRKILNQTDSILQVVYGSTSTQVSTSANTWSDTGLTASITPSTTSSKILVILSQNGLLKSPVASTYANFQLLRNSTALANFGYVDLYNNGAYYMGGNSNFQYLDSPSTTSSVSYKTQFAAVGGCTVDCQRDNTPNSSIVLIEIAG